MPIRALVPLDRFGEATVQRSVADALPDLREKAVSKVDKSGATVSSTFLSSSAHSERALRLASHRFTDAEYAAYWKSRIRARCVVSPTGCWLWRLNTRQGYGQTSYRGKTVSVHRRMLELKLGRKLTPQECACHSCDTRACCNEDHLWPGTKLDNNFDSVRKGRHKNLVKTHCPQGHEYTPENISHRIEKSGRPGRGCKMCMKIRSQSEDYRAKARERQRRARQTRREQRL